jgi:capsular exopolysaccharide synthesis family protein
VAARSYYGENHPEYRKAKQQLEEAEAQVEAMRVATNERTEANYRQALDRELLIKRQFEQTKAEIDALKGNSLAYSELKTEAENDRRIYLELESRMRDADVNRQFRDATIQFVAPALPPAAAIFPKLTVNLPVAFVLALVMGVLGAIAAEALDNTFSDAEELTARVRLEVMATLPDIRPLRKHGALTSTFHTVYSRSLEMGARYEESIRMLRNAIGRMRTQQAMDEPPRTLLITSGNAGEGKSTTAARLAEACARGGKKVLLIDADLWRPSVLKKFDVYSKLGLADVLANGISPADVIVEVIPGLFIMPAGPALMNPADLIGLSFSNVLSQVKSHFDLVIIDAPPLLGPSETQEIATMVDSVLVIVRAHATSAKHLAETLKTLSRSRANVAGIVLNRVKVANLRGFANYYDPAAASEHFRGAGVTG